MSYSVWAQTKERNYVKTVVYLNSLRTDSIVSVQYYDGLGRPDLLVTGGSNTVRKYLHTLTEYDVLGRESQIWAPVVGGTKPDYKTKSAIKTASQSTYNDSKGYSKITYDALDRVTFESTPGQAWGNRGKTTSYRANNASDKVRKYTPTSDGLLGKTFYSANTLSVTESKDEDDKMVKVFTDFLGRTILERKVNGTENVDTYYVYDDLGQLAYVLPPMYNANPSAANLKLYAFSYTYDSRGRVASKTIPGSDAVKYWYDNADRIVKMQDGILNQAGKYRVYTYDNLGRVKKQSISNGSKVEYDEIENFYDSDFTKLISDNSYLQSTASINNRINEAKNSQYGKGLISMTKQRASNGESLYTVFCYNDKGLVSYKLEIGLDKHVTVSGYEYNFVGDVTKESFEEYDYVSSTHSLKKTYTGYTTNVYYPHTRLLKSSVLTINDYKNNNKMETNVLSQLQYDDLGNVTDNDRTGDVADMHYEYDRLHGWVKKITTPKYWFEQNIYRESGAVKPCYNGSIAAMDWKVQKDYRRRYDYQYDGLNRLTDANFSYFTAGSSDYSVTSTQRMLPNSNGKGQDYTVHYRYDLNSNISHIKRMGRDSYSSSSDNFGVIEDNDVIRNGNQLKAYNPPASMVSYYGSFDFDNKVNKQDEYAYDKNGNLTRDDNKGMTFTYDLLGHPLAIVGSSNRTDYVYSADGRKLRATHTQYTSKNTVKTQVKTNYRGRIVANDGVNIRFLFSGGFYTFKKDTLDVCHYFIQDYQGNNRILIGTNKLVDQYSHYYPYGGLMGDISTNDAHSYKYGGKELDRDFGIDLFDFEARQYDAKVPGFTSIDPLAEKYYGISPYAYCAGDPVNCVDRDGREPTPYAAALMSAAAYGDKVLEALEEEGWTPVGLECLRLQNSFSGLKYSVFQHEKDDGSVEYTLAFAGTEILSDTRADVTADIEQLVGMSAQYEDAVAVAACVSKELEGQELTISGHSLGGGEAALASMVTGRKAITFNSAALSEATLRNFGLRRGDATLANVDNYVAVGRKFDFGNFSIYMGGDFVNNFQNNCGMQLPGITYGVYTGIMPTHGIGRIIKAIKYGTK